MPLHPLRGPSPAYRSTGQKVSSHLVHDFLPPVRETWYVGINARSTGVDPGLPCDANDFWHFTRVEDAVGGAAEGGA